MDFVCNLLDETTAELPDNRDANKWEECKTAMKAAIDAAEEDPLEIVTVDEDHANEAAVGQQTIRFNLDREPRFYAWVAFQGGYYEVTSASSLGAYADDASYDSEKRRLVCDFVLGGNTSRGISSSMRTNNYSPTGYLNKKAVSPDQSMTTSLQTPFFYPWSVIRLADLYLGHAEVCMETLWSGIASLTQGQHTAHLAG